MNCDELDYETIANDMQMIEVELNPGHIFAFSEGLDYDIERAENLKSMFFGGK